MQWLIDIVLEAVNDMLKATYTFGHGIFSSVTTPKINPDALQNIHVWSDGEVEVDEAGKYFYWHRKDADGDDYTETHLSTDGDSHFRSTGVFYLDSGIGKFLALQSTGDDVRFGSYWMGVKNPRLLHYGYITADNNEKWIKFRLNDITDYYELTREDAYVLGFDVQMPLQANEFKVSGTKVVGAQGNAVADSTGAGDIVARLNELLAEIRTHGLIAT